MSYKIQYGNEVVCLPAAALESCGELLQLRLLMLLSLDRSMASAEHTVLAERLGCTEEELSDTVAALRAVRLLAPEQRLAPSAQTKNLAGEEIAAVVEKEQGFRQLLDECQNICGKIFTPTDISKIISIRTELGFDGETILLLFFYCSEKLDAVGRKVSVSYVEKTAYSLYHRGVRDLTGLQNYIKRTEEENSLAFRLRRLFGIGDRSFTKKEKRFFDKWSGEWQTPYELIEYAYNITVDSTGKPSLEYMSTILSGWHDKQIQTVAEAEKSTEEHRRSSGFRERPAEKSASASPSSFNTEEFFEKALQRSYAMMNEENRTRKKDEHGI